MNAVRLISGVSAFFCVLIVLSLGAGCSSRPCIRGSYVLDYRELPDGKVVRPPDVIGMMTFTKTHRNFNVYWQEAGKPASISVVSRYTLSKTEFTEENIYTATNGVDGKGPTYDTSSASDKSPVTIDNGKTQFKFPLHDEPKVTFEKDGFTAIRLGAFVDHWKRVN